MLWVLTRIAKAILMSTHNIGFYEDWRKIIFQLSSNTHLISSSDYGLIIRLHKEQRTTDINISSQEHLRTKVTQSLPPTYLGKT